MYLRILFTSVFACVLFCGCAPQKNDGVDSGKSGKEEIAFPDFPSINTDNVFVYECGSDSLRLTAYVEQDSAWLILPDTSLKVMKVRSGSGAKYRNDFYLYWSKGDKALLQLPTGSLMKCESLSRERSWEAARLLGVDFRALGQEPGWHLEITDGKQIKYIGNYGADTLIAPVPKPEVDSLGERTIYLAEAENRTLKVEILNEPCTDIMSGFDFPSTVTVTIDRKTYHGCGKTLK